MVLRAALIRCAEAIAGIGGSPGFKMEEPWWIKRTEFDQWIDAQLRDRDGGGRDE